MKIKSAELEIVCGIKSELPKNTLPEVGFIGKSNVGKSSLINSLLNRKSLARTSSEPGKTRTLNFYNINKEIYLVDLPGYGFAKVSKEDRESFGRMTERYLITSEMLSAMFLLIDIRHEPTELDKKMYSYLKYLEIETVVIMTKADKIKRSRLKENIKKIKEGLMADDDLIMIPYSSVTNEGREDVLDLLLQIKEWEN